MNPLPTKRVKPVASCYHIRQPISTWTRLFLQVFGIVTVVSLYQTMAWWQHTDVKFLNHVGNPTDTTVPFLGSFLEGFRSILKPRFEGHCWLVTDFKITYGRLLWGMALSTLLSSILGTLMGCYKSVEALFGLTVSAMGKCPATAILAAFFILLGTGENLYTGVIVFGTMPWMTQAILTAVHEDVSREAVNKMITFHASPAEQVYNLVWKQVLPKVIESSRLATATALITLLATEMYVGGSGFGYRLKINSFRLNMDVVYIYLGILVVIGYLTDFAFLQVRAYLCPWFGEQNEKKSSWFSFLKSVKV